jgi:hypothetical protein
MALLYDNNVANYLKRAAMNQGLNGLTEFSLAFSLNLAASTGTTQRIIARDAEGVNGRPYRVNWDDPGGIDFAIANTGATQSPDWLATTLPSYSVWTRVLFTFKRNNIDATDGIVYYNGTSQSTTFTATGYASTFALVDGSANYYLGIRPITFINPCNGLMDWPTIWTRKLTQAEATADALDPTAVRTNMVSQVQSMNGSNNDRVFGGSMTINGSLAYASGNSAAIGMQLSHKRHYKIGY